MTHAATESEVSARQTDESETIRIAKLIKSPLDLSDDAAWRKWAAGVACEIHPNDVEKATILSHLSYKHGKRNQEWAHQITSTAWQEGLHLSKQEANKWKDENSSEAERITCSCQERKSLSTGSV